MKRKIKNLAAAAALLSTVMAGGHLRSETAYDKLVPAAESFVLKNGIKVFYVGDELPQITIAASVGYGKLYEKKDTAGLSDLLARTLSISGSRKYPGGKMHEAVDSAGGQISVASSWEGIVVSVKVLKKFAPLAFDVLSDLVANPNFDEKYFQTAKSIYSAHIKKKFDDPGNLAIEKLREVIFDGEGYGSFPTQELVSSYTLAAAESAWRKHFVGGNIIIGVSSSMDLADVKTGIERYFSSVAPGPRIDYETDVKSLAARTASMKGKVFFYEKDIPQCTIVFGAPVPDIHYQGAYALSVMNYILGGGSFNSRLMNEIRVKRGLAYSVMSVVRFRHRTGVFIAFAQTENQNADRVMELLDSGIRGMTSAAGLAGELDWAKRSILNSFIFNFDTPMNILSNRIEIEYNGLPATYYSDYPGNISRVTVDDMRREAGLISNAGMVRLVVGKGDIRDRLSRFGEVVLIK